MDRRVPVTDASRASRLKLTPRVSSECCTSFSWRVLPPFQTLYHPQAPRGLLLFLATLIHLAILQARIGQARARHQDPRLLVSGCGLTEDRHPPHLVIRPAKEQDRVSLPPTRQLPNSCPQPWPYRRGALRIHNFWSSFWRECLLNLFTFLLKFLDKHSPVSARHGPRHNTFPTTAAMAFCLHPEVRRRRRCSRARRLLQMDHGNSRRQRDH